MDPMGLLAIIGLGAQIIGGFRAQQEAARQQALMEAAMDRQAQAAMDFLNFATQYANKDITAALTPQFSALQSRALANVSGLASASGLAGSGLAAAAEMGVRGDISAALAQQLLEWEKAKLAPLFQAQAGLSGVFGEQAKLRGALMGQFAEMGPDLSWLPTFLQVRPNAFNFDLSWLANLFGGGGSVGGPTQMIAD